MWRDLLPQAVRYAVANYNLATDFDQAMDHADNVYYAQKPGAEADVKEVAAVKVDVKVDKKPPDETAPELQLDVADVSDFDIDDRQTWESYTAPKSK